MTARATVSAVGGDGLVDLTIDAASRCEGCTGVCLWRRLPVKTHARLPSSAPLRVGTEVLVALPQRYVLLSALLLHGLPWVALLAGAAAGAYVAGHDLGAVAGAVLAVTFSIIMTPGLRRRLEKAAMERFSLRPIA
jgi:positive regulator of sigma E activity